MEQHVNALYAPVFTSDKRYIILMGGRAAGRSTGITQKTSADLFADAYSRCAIMRYVLGDIRNSIFREMLDRLTETGGIDFVDVNSAAMSIRYNNNIITSHGFKKSSEGQTAKLKGLANYNRVVIDEADEVGEEEFMQLDDSVRTVKGDLKIQIILALNPPPKDHWIIKRWFTLLPSGVEGFYKPVLREGVQDVEFIHSTFEDNIENLDAETVLRYRGYKDTKPSHYYRNILGLVPETVTGKIFNNWLEIEKLPHEARLIRRGLDFGYTNDPTAIVDVYKYNGGYILDEVCYQVGMQMSDVSSLILAQEKPHALTIADSSDPRSIDDLKGRGLNVVGAIKGKDSIRFGIDFVKDQRISFTARSKNIKKEYENYAWRVTRDGEVTQEPIDHWNHAMDAIRYAFEGLNVQSVRRPSYKIQRS